MLHLAFVDLCCCLILGPIYASMYFPERWLWGATTCQMVYPIILFFTFIDWVSLSFVALTRCINLMRPVFWTNFCDKKINVILTILSIWVIGGVWIMPDIIEVIKSIIVAKYNFKWSITFSYFFGILILFASQPTVELGWNCKTGQCTTIKTETVPILSKVICMDFQPI